MSYTLIDTHAHAYDPDLTAIYGEWTERASNNQLSKILLPNIDIESIAQMYELVDKDPTRCVPMMGLHPCSVKANYEDVLSQIKGELYSKKYPFCAVGEIGLDYHWDTTFIEEQKSAFKMQIEWAIDLNIPIAVHTRKSLDEAIHIIKTYRTQKLKGVIHCFGGSLQQANQIIDLGFYMGIGGVITYKNAGLAEIVKDIDLKHLVLETDAPYLTPVPHRGKLNEPSYVKYVAEKIAEIKGLSLEEVAAQTTENARNLFSIY